jgi:hypothetical protein
MKIKATFLGRGSSRNEIYSIDGVSFSRNVTVTIDEPIARRIEEHGMAAFFRFVPPLDMKPPAGMEIKKERGPAGESGPPKEKKVKGGNK